MKVKLPKVMFFRDYHDIKYCGQNIKAVLPAIKWKEIGMSGSSYVGIYYIDKTDEVKKIIKSWKEQE